ncbi:MAG: squalene synthase HpnC [Solirubrobacterales bacterium]|nr:squalene synthase HpnC [Solirubrobacterales bacterium]
MAGGLAIRLTAATTPLAEQAPAVGAAPPPAPEAVMAQARTENFPVASRVLGPRTRSDLLALYGFARLVDDAGDEAVGNRLALLAEIEADLERAFTGTARHSLIARLEPTISARKLSIEPFRRLIEANRRDQVKHRYESFEELLGYCQLSANPVGELVLGVFGAATPERVALSDAICSGLQLVEHWQDVAEDYDRGRIYLPLADCRELGVSESDLGLPEPTAELRALLRLEVIRARRLLDQGAPLIGTLRGRPALAIALFVAGGRAALKAIVRADYDVLSMRPRPSRGLRMAELLATLLGRAGR